jgi:hypothetical protein
LVVDDGKGTLGGCVHVDGDELVAFRDRQKLEVAYDFRDALRAVPCLRDELESLAQGGARIRGTRR